MMELGWHERSDLVAQAAGIVSVQAECPLEQALKLTHQRARSTETTVETVALSVIDRRVRVEAHP